jgi:glycosyltransferase involved in cell wall biosynthesis
MILNINGLFLKYLSVGLGKYSYQLIKHLNKNHKDINLYIPNDEIIDDDTLNSLGNVYVHKLGAIKKTGNEFIDTRLWELSLYRKMRKEKNSILFSPYFICSPYSIENEVVTIGDIVQYVYPQYVTSIPRYLLNLYNRQYIKNVQKIITFSNFSRDEIQKHFNIDTRRIYPIHLGVSEIFQQKKSKEAFKNIKSKYRLPDRYILYLGGYDYRKSILTLLEAFKKVKNMPHTNELTLVLSGNVPPKIKSIVPDIRKAIKNLNIESNIQFTGYVPEEDLPFLYSMAEIFVYPSFYEGFGLPVLEAMACGTPIIACNSTSIPEIVNRKDILFSPHNVKDLSNIIYTLCNDKSYRKELSVWGIARANIFTWEKTSRLTDSVLNS